MINTAVVEGTGYSLNFLHDANLDTTAPLDSSTNYRPNIYAYAGASDRIYSYIRTNTSTATYYLMGVGAASNGQKQPSHT
jgi:hypothetical protein